jgi:hypothetical protein
MQALDSSRAALAPMLEPELHLAQRRARAPNAPARPAWCQDPQAHKPKVCCAGVFEQIYEGQAPSGQRLIG